MKRRHHMTEQERHQLEAMRRNKIPVREIARQLGFCERTIYYELRRGSYIHTCDFWDETRYLAQKGQQILLATEIYQSMAMEISRVIR